MPRYRFKDTDDACVGAIDFELPHGPGRVTVAAVGDDRADALGKAALIAERIANDPIMSALMPPQAKAAIVVAKGLAASAKRGSRYVKHFWRKLRGPGKKRLAKVLHDEAVKREQEEVSGFEVGIRNPFKRKKKRKVPNRLPRQRVQRQPPPEPEPQQEEAPDSPDEGDNTDDGAEE